MNVGFLGLRFQLQELKRETDATLRQVQKFQNQLVVKTELLQCTAANAQNTSNTSATQWTQLSSSVSRQLDNITKVLNINFDCINQKLKKSFYNQNIMYNTMETCHLNTEQRFASVEAHLAKLGTQTQSCVVQSPQRYPVWY